jgi:lipopolysaccharide biosynthesis glycosyltransferase
MATDLHDACESAPSELIEKVSPREDGSVETRSGSRIGVRPVLRPDFPGHELGGSDFVTFDGSGSRVGGYVPARPQSFVRFTGLTSPVLLLVVDTEEGFDWSAPFSSDRHSVSAIKQLHLCQSLFERFAIRPTYVVDYPIASHASAARELRSLAASGRCIIGSQLHPWVNPPLVERLNLYNSFPGNLPADLELEKLRILSECIAENLGTRPQIYKAGRYGIGPNTAGILRRLGYRVDISIHPRRVYQQEGGPDFRRIPPQPFWLDEDERLLEIPLTCDYYGLFHRWAENLYHDCLTTAPGMALHLPGISARLGLLNRVSISPEGYPLGEAKRLTKALVERGVQVFTLAFHSPSLEPGNTPYVRSQRDLEALLAWLARYIEFFLDKIGGRPATPLDLWALARREAADGERRGEGDRSGDRSWRVRKVADAAAPLAAGMAVAATPAEVRARERIPVLMCINARYAQHAAVCLVSLLENNPDSFFEVVVVSTGELADEAAKLRRSLARYENHTLTIRYFSRSTTVNLPITAQHYSIDNYTRLWISEFFPNETKKVLYIDSDMVIVDSIQELWNTDITEWVLGAVSIPGSDRCPIFGIPERYGYFNSGVLLVNLERWRSEKVFDRLIEYIAANSDKIIDVDQDVLNACLYDRWLHLPHIWNTISPFYINYYPIDVSPRELRRIRSETRIIHFNGASKPWSYLCRHPRRMEYWKYLAKTAWCDYSEEDRSAINWLKKHVGSRIPPEMRNQLKNIVRDGLAWVHGLTAAKDRWRGPEAGRRKPAALRAQR